MTKLEDTIKKFYDSLNSGAEVEFKWTDEVPDFETYIRPREAVLSLGDCVPFGPDISEEGVEMRVQVMLNQERGKNKQFLGLDYGLSQEFIKIPKEVLKRVGIDKKLYNVLKMHLEYVSDKKLVVYLHNSSLSLPRDVRVLLSAEDLAILEEAEKRRNSSSE